MDCALQTTVAYREVQMIVKTRRPQPTVSAEGGMWRERVVRGAQTGSLGEILLAKCSPRKVPGEEGWLRELKLLFSAGILSAKCVPSEGDQGSSNWMVFYPAIWNVSRTACLHSTWLKELDPVSVQP